MDDYRKQVYTVAMTNAQWSTLTTYILTTTQSRRQEREAWERIMAEVDAEGLPKFPNAADNAKYYVELEAELDAILKCIDGASSGD